MNSFRWKNRLLPVATAALFATTTSAQTSAAPDSPAPYKLINTIGFLCPGRFDYFSIDSEARRIYVPRGDDIMVFDADTLEQFKPIIGLKRGYGLALDPVSHHGFAAGRQIFMWDTATSLPIKSIPVPCEPYKNIVFDPLTEHIFVFNHPLPPPTPKPLSPGAPAPVVAAPPANGTTLPASEPAPPQSGAVVLDGKDGSIVGTFDIGGEPEQAVSDGMGHLYVDLSKTDSVAMVDVKTLKVTATYSLGGKGQNPIGLAIDTKNNILFISCLNSSNVVMLDATNGKFLQALPVGKVPEGIVFNPKTMEVFCSAGIGNLTVIKETSPTSFEVEQTIPTFTHGRTCASDSKTNHIVVICPEHLDKAPSPGDPPMPTLDSAPSTSSSPAQAPSGAPSLTDGPAAAYVPPVPKNGHVKFHIFVFGR